MDYITEISAGVLSYDNRIFDTDWLPYEQALENYFTISDFTTELYALLHLESSTKTPVFELSAPAVNLML